MLDECDEQSREVFLQRLQALLRRADIANQYMKIIIAGRPHIPVTNELPVGCFTEIPLDSGDIGKDIYEYVVGNVRKLSATRNFTSLEQEIQDTLVEGANGMFLWVSLIVDSLNKIKHSTPKHIRQKLNELPRDIAALYAGILKRIDAEYEVIARVILQWIVYAVRPLTLEELAIAIAITPAHTSQEDMRDDMELDLKGLLQAIFGPLVVIGNDGTVNLVHQSAKDFLVDITSEGQGNLGSKKCFRYVSSRFGLSRQDANTVLSTACMSYLCFDELESIPPCLDIGSQQLSSWFDSTKRYLFLRYAAMYWPHHVRCISYDRVGLGDRKSVV